MRRIAAKHRLVAVAIVSFAVGCSSAGGEPAGGGGGGPPPPPVVALVAQPDSLVTLEGETGLFTVKLSSAPESPATVVARVDRGANILSLTGATTLQFDEVTWDTPQAVDYAVLLDADAVNDWGRVELNLNGGADIVYVDITQDDIDVVPPAPDGIDLTVKDASGVGVIDHPVVAVIPLPQGVFQDTSALRIEDGGGNIQAAQFEVVNRWWARDNSIRHVAAHFLATVPPDSEATYRFEMDRSGPQLANPVTVTESGDTVTVDTGVLRFRMRRDAFNLFDEVWLDDNGNGSYEADEKIVQAGAGDGPVFTGRQAGDIQRARDRSDVVWTIEETGPMRAVIRISAPTRFVSATDHTHGFAARVYAYAGKSYVKVDYQLQNSATNVAFSEPLYFEDVSLHIHPDLTAPTVRHTTKTGSTWSGALGGGSYLFQKSLTDTEVRSGSGALLTSGTNAPEVASGGWSDVSDGRRGVFVAVRHMAEMWPNGIEAAASGDIAVRLWPEWSAQWHEKQLNSTGLYWLEDMQHVVKEALVYFHGSGVSSQTLDDLALNFQYHPIAFVPVSWYDDTRVTLDLNGILPTRTPLPGQDTKRLQLMARDVNPADDHYNFGWANFLGDTGRKYAAAGGGWPGGAAEALASQRVDKWLQAEAAVLGDLNVRAMWMDDYSYADDFALLELTSSPYAGSSWRAVDAPGPNYIAGTGFSGWRPRDNPHAWFYHIEEFYYLSANPWIKDWYRFIGEFRKGERSGDNLKGAHARFGWSASRGEAHSITNSLQAYRVTGDPVLIDHIRNRMRDSVLLNRSPIWGDWADANNEQAEAAFQAGFLARAIIQFIEETPETDLEHHQAFQILWGVVDWNHNHSQFTYYIGHGDPLAASSGTSGTMGDPIAWFVQRTGLEPYMDRLNDYIATGLNGGVGPYADLKDWNGDWIGRMAVYARNHPVVPAPPSAISNLTATQAGSRARLEWDTPANAAKFHVVWSEFPISGTWTTDPAQRNAWAATPVLQTLAASPGTRQSLEIDSLPTGQTLHFAVFVLGDNGHMSGISNVATVTLN